ncbi:MAG: outer membrane protein OmpK [Porticoccaceae bacterium]|nr:outer membrane protein OmpK [Porticoccaceae bacterium]
MQFKQWITHLGAALLATTFAISSQAEIWSSTEVHYSNGDLLNPFSKKDEDTSIITFQHAGGHKYGDNFFFIDHSRVKDGKSEFYGEWYSNFSLGAITGNDMSFGAVKDVGLIAGFNFAPAVDSTWFLPGVRLALDLPGFAFANLDITGYNNVTTGANANEEESSYMLDFNWAYPFKAGGFSWSVEGHAEYIAGRDVINTSGAKQSEKENWILMQPQLRMDLGEALGNEAGNFYVGLEYQYWKNKLGQKDQNESTVQLLTVWNF